MGSYLLIFGLGALISAMFSPVALRGATNFGLLDDTRDPPVPRAGGWALATGTLLSLLLVGFVFTPTGATLTGSGHPLAPIVSGTLAILLLGTADDITPLSARLKFAVQIGIAAAVFAWGLRVEVLSTPFGTVQLGMWASLGVTVLWLVGISNAFNLLDGADGVAAGAAFFAATAVFIMAVTLGNPAIGLIAAALAGSLLGFLPFNFPPARLFLGDSGSLFIGFLLAALAVPSTTKGPTLVAIAVPLMAFAVPVFDTSITMLRRLVRGRPVFERDREHLHHRLEKAGFTPRQVAGVIYAASAGFALLSMLFLNPNVRSYAVVLIILGAAVWLMVRYLKLHELNELARVARRSVLQPKSIAMNVGLRRAAERLERTETLDDLLNSLALLLARSEFDRVVLVVTRGHDRRGHARAWRLERGEFIEGWPDRPSDEWEVVCPFDGNGWRGELRLRRRLGRRTLLLDLNLLLEIVQPALVRAAQRIDPDTLPVSG